MISPDQLAADLEWAIASEPLLAGFAPLNFENPDHKIPPVPDSHRVGYYFESLVEFWLREIRKVEIVASGLQIQEGTRTVGELDFVFRDEAARLIHWEVAVKFYLHFPHENHTGSHYIGPNAADTLERKFSRLVNHQLPLGKKAFPEIEEATAFVKGRIFYHFEAGSSSISPLLSPNHLKGRWLRFSEMDLLRKNEKYKILHKPLWLNGSENFLDSVSAGEIGETAAVYFKNSNHPLLLFATGELDLEPSFIFIVNDRWPEVG